ncbi:hypothetical protein LIER_30170 [Lithospermum erythrorhizon]|uniref:Kiwellin n=1 Tax=Lithospermum erythrorhizon TaxID=34254 RepID=A0AAV3RSM6_LITER
MAKLISSFILSLIISIVMPSPGHAVSYCNDPCQSLDDCDGQLICINAKCNDDPEVGTTECGGGGAPPSTGNLSTSCQQLGTLTCLGRSYPTYDCSPPVTSSTMAKLTFNHFSEGGITSKCDGRVYGNDELIVALSTGWYDNGLRCLKMIKVMGGNGRSVEAKVVDECDSLHGCEEGHEGQPPCPNNIVDGSRGVWEGLGLDLHQGIVDVVWFMV